MQSLLGKDAVDDHFVALNNNAFGDRPLVNLDGNRRTTGGVCPVTVKQAGIVGALCLTSASAGVAIVLGAEWSDRATEVISRTVVGCYVWVGKTNPDVTVGSSFYLDTCREIDCLKQGMVVVVDIIFGVKFMKGDIFEIHSVCPHTDSVLDTS